MGCWLNNYKVEGAIHLCWPIISPYSIRHFAALGDNISGWEKGAHLVVGFLEAIPIIGQAASGCEWLAQYFFHHGVVVDRTAESQKVTKTVLSAISSLETLSSGSPLPEEPIMPEQQLEPMINPENGKLQRPTTKFALYPSKGFPNPSLENCPYNSYAVACSHTTNSESLDEWIRQQEELTFEPTANEIELIQKEKEKTRQEIKKITIKLKSNDINPKELKEKILLLGKEIKDLRTTNGNILFGPMKKAREEKNTKLTEEFASIVKINREKIASLEKELETLNKIKELSKKIEELELQLTNLEKKESALIEDYSDRKRAVEVLKIVRNEKKGELCEKDAQILYKYGQFDKKEFHLDQFIFFKDGIENKEEVKELSDNELAETLKEVLSRDEMIQKYRIIRIGGGAHWWTYVRVDLGKTWREDTWDRISDTHITSKDMTSGEIFDRFKKKAAWEGNFGQQFTMF